MFVGAIHTGLKCETRNSCNLLRLIHSLYEIKDQLNARDDL